MYEVIVNGSEYICPSKSLPLLAFTKAQDLKLPYEGAPSETEYAEQFLKSIGIKVKKINDN